MPPSTTSSATHLSSYFSLTPSSLTLGNALIERRWQIQNGQLTATHFLDKRTNHQWCLRPASRPITLGHQSTGGELLSARHVISKRSVVEEESLQVTLRIRRADGTEVDHRFVIFESAAGVTMSAAEVREGAAGARGELKEGRQTAKLSRGEPVEGRQEPAATPQATGVEDKPFEWGWLPDADIVDALDLDWLHLRFTAVELVDRTDIHDTLAFEKSWLMHVNEPDINAKGNLFFLQHTLRHDGLIIIKHAPLPHARPTKCPRDITIYDGKTVVTGHGGPDGNEVTIIAYANGRAGRIAALQRHQRNFRTYVPGRDGLLVSNTWGDRSKDGRISEAFVLQEVAAAAKLGVDVVQIDDGWQRGRTANSVNAGGVWNSFWEADPNFWSPHNQRFPNGLGEVTRAVRAHCLKLGLWYAPDSSNDFSNAQRDAAQILALHREHGATAIKIDGVKMHSAIGEKNLRAMFDRVLADSAGEVVFDLDVTAETRPGYFGMIAPGPLFVENRYTDFHRYFPHHTLRNLWMLAHYIDPVRLRIEFLNNTRKDEIYGNADPLRPSVYDPDYLFAITMMAAPLAWCEVSNLPAAYVERVSKLVAIWKQHREAIHRGPIIPIGREPDGTSWAGFAAGAKGSPRYVLVFRELNDSPTAEFEAPVEPGDTAQVLAGSGRMTCGNGRVTVEMPRPLSYCFAQISSEERKPR